MNTPLKLITTILLAGIISQPIPSIASAFHSWSITNVEWNDALNIRKYPSSKSQILTAYQNGVHLSLTGRCTKNLNLDDLHYPTPWDLKHAVRFRWCEVWVNPAGDDDFKSGWVYGKYIEPNL